MTKLVALLWLLALAAVAIAYHLLFDLSGRIALADWRRS